MKQWNVFISPSSGGRTKDLDDVIQLVDVRVSWEERLPGQHLHQQAAHRPHIHRPGTLDTQCAVINTWNP